MSGSRRRSRRGRAAVGDLPANPLAFLEAYQGRDSAAGEAADALTSFFRILTVVRMVGAMGGVRLPPPVQVEDQRPHLPPPHRAPAEVRRKAIDTEARELP